MAQRPVGGEEMPVQGASMKQVLRLAYPLFAALGVMFSVSAMVLAVFNYFVPAISSELDLSSAEISLSMSIYLAALIFAMPVAGIIVDRIGSRLTIITSGMLFSGCLLWISQADSALTLYLSFGLAAVLGAGASAVSYMRVIVHTFKRYRGLALGIAMSGGGLVGMILPTLVVTVIADHGWRMGFIVLAVLAAAVHLAGGAMAADFGTSPVEKEEKQRSFSLVQALNTGPFWMMALSFAIFGMVVAAVTAHLTGIWNALGLDQVNVPTFHFGMGASAIAGRVIGGALMDKIAAKYVGAGAALICAFGLLILAYQHNNPILLIASSLAVGFAVGAESDVVSYLSAQYFGLQNFGRIYSIFASTFMAGAAAGPVSFALLVPLTGHADLLGLLSFGLMLSAVMLFLLYAPQPTLQPSQVS